MSTVRKAISSLIFLVICLVGNAQGGFFFNQHQTEVADTCEYGDLVNYSIVSIYYASGDVGSFDSVAEVKQVIDCFRDPECSDIISGSSNYAYRTPSIGDYILTSSGGIIECNLAISPSNYVVLGGFPFIDPVYIIAFTSGEITYSEIY